MRTPAFWDTSALVPLCAQQAITPDVISLYENHTAVIWWATPVEIASAIARLTRMKQLDAGGRIEARGLAKQLAESWSVIQPTDAILLMAAQFVDRFELRPADSLQLAAALTWCGEVPEGRLFFSADLKLRDAARRCGFDAIRL